MPLVQASTDLADRQRKALDRDKRKALARDKGRHRAPISRARLALLAATLVVGSAGTALASAAGWF